MTQIKNKNKFNKITTKKNRNYIQRYNKRKSNYIKMNIKRKSNCNKNINLIKIIQQNKLENKVLKVRMEVLEHKVKLKACLKRDMMNKNTKKVNCLKMFNHPKKKLKNRFYSLLPKLMQIKLKPKSTTKYCKHQRRLHMYCLNKKTQLIKLNQKKIV